MPHILVVDDQLPSARATARLFRSDGFEASFVTSGPEALALLASGGPAPLVVLLDINMPEMDGLEVLRRIRSEPAHGDLAVVMYTALSDDATRAAAEALGADGYVVKTCPWEDLRQAVVPHVRPAEGSLKQLA